MGNLTSYARKELERAGWFGEDSLYGGAIADAVMELIKVFEEQKHSGLSASIVRNLFNRLSNFRPISPLTFEDDEWIALGAETGTYVNKRYSSIFKDGINGKPYNIDAFYMRNEQDKTFTGKLWIDENRYIAKCYVKDPANIPDPIEINVKEINGRDLLVNKSELDELEKYYDLEIKDAKTQ